MANVLTDEKKQQVLALGRLGWSLRRIEQATGVRRETASIYLKTAGIAVRSAGGWGRRSALLGSAKSVPEAGVVPSTDARRVADPDRSKPANEVTTDFGVEKVAPRVSADLHRQEPTPEATLELDTSKPANEVTTDPVSPQATVGVTAPLGPRRGARARAGAFRASLAKSLGQCLRTVPRTD
jgi:hypothetical protein